MVTANIAGSVDGRGYRGSEKNRKLPPEEVMWARAEYFEGRVTTRQLMIKWGLGKDAVGKILRGDTYGNVGMAPVMAEALQAQLDATAPPEREGLLEELLAAQEKAEGKKLETPEGGGLPEYLRPKKEAPGDPMDGTPNLFDEGG